MKNALLVALLIGGLYYVVKDASSNLKGMPDEAEPVYNQPNMKTKVPANVDHNDIWLM